MDDVLSVMSIYGTNSTTYNSIQGIGLSQKSEFLLLMYILVCLLVKSNTIQDTPHR